MVLASHGSVEHQIDVVFFMFAKTVRVLKLQVRFLKTTSPVGPCVPPCSRCIFHLLVYYCRARRLDFDVCCVLGLDVASLGSVEHQIGAVFLMFAKAVRVFETSSAFSEKTSSPVGPCVPHVGAVYFIIGV